VAKRFGSTVALAGLDLDLFPGSVQVLMGANGSGKSTLVKVMAGVERADSGDIDTGGGWEQLRGWTPATAQAAGLHFVHQNLGLFDDLSVTENLAIGHGFQTRLGTAIRGRYHRERARQIIEEFRIRTRPEARAGELSQGQRALLAIARGLQDDGDPQDVQRRVLVLDEPTAALGAAEAGTLLAVLRGVAAAGSCVVYVSHRLQEVFAIADTITVFRDGRITLTGAKSDLSRERVVSAMSGGVPLPGSPTLPASTAQPGGIAAAGPASLALQVRGVALGPLTDVNLDLEYGEIVGIAGLQGSGRTLLLRAIFGDLRPRSGQISVDGRAVDFRSPADAVQAGIGLVPSDRAGDAIFPTLSLRENLLVADWKRFRKQGRMPAGLQQSAAAAAISQFGVKTASTDAQMGALSGGNQQKAMLARWFVRGSRVLLLDEPTQGVDVVARKDIWKMARQMAADGAAILVVSSDFEELAEAADRVCVLSDGILTDLPAGEITEESIMLACSTAGHQGTRIPGMAR
jgi:ribose transport system ATP-binding protein